MVMVFNFSKEDPAATRDPKYKLLLKSFIKFSKKIFCVAITLSQNFRGLKFIANCYAVSLDLQPRYSKLNQRLFAEDLPIFLFTPWESFAYESHYNKYANFFSRGFLFT